MKIILWAVFLAVASAFVYKVAWPHVFPCNVPVTYSIGSVDPRFGISSNAFSAAADAAAAMWEKASGRKLFTHVSEGGVVIRAVYDVRQKVTTDLSTINQTIAQEKQSLQTSETELAAKKKSYDDAKAAYNKDLAAFNARRTAYEAKVAALNARGNATPEEVSAINGERDSLNAEIPNLQKKAAALTSMAAEINTLVASSNTVVSDHNQNVDQYNQEGASLGGEFHEGIYQKDQNGERIDAYVFDSPESLTYLLAHELGHARGLGHIDDKNAIMYRLNWSSAPKVTAADLQALTDYCDSPHFLP